VDVRVVAATHRDLRQAVAKGTFREDLYFRLAVFPIRVPPLRERLDDLVPLVTAFAADLAGAESTVTVTPEGEVALRQHPWPGNVRELRNFVERLVLLRGRGPLVIDAAAAAVLAFGDPLPPARPPAADGSVPGLGEKGYRELVDDFERALVRAALERSNGNVAAAARLLRADRGNLYRRIKALGISADDDGGPI
jgi:DNA-binding NtrC family response regulator